MTMSDFVYRNVNPDNESINDCVTRAISTAIGLKYHAVENLLMLSANNFGCDALVLSCYQNLLEKVLCYRGHECYNGETVGEISKRYKNHKVLIRIDQHLTCSMYGVIEDLWDCTEKLVTKYWIVD